MMDKGGEFGIENPGVKGKTLGIATKQGCFSGSVMSTWMRSGPAGSGISIPSATGPSSSRGLDVEIASLNLSALMREAQTLTTSPLASFKRIVTGQMTSIASPRLPAISSSFSAPWVANGQERIAVLKFG